MVFLGLVESKQTEQGLGPGANQVLPFTALVWEIDTQLLLKQQHSPYIEHMFKVRKLAESGD